MKFLSTLCLIVVIAGSGFYIYSFLLNPCQIPITVYIDELDPRFGLDRSDANKALEASVREWEDAVGQELFDVVGQSAKPEALKVSFVYDERQASADTLSGLKEVLDVEKENYETLKAHYDEKRNQYDRLSAEYDRAIKSGQRGNEVESMRREINSLAGELNSLSIQINSLAGSTNEIVEEYNNVNDSQGEEFDQGLYEREGRNKNITIYQFTSLIDLQSILTHELGHALSLEHSEDPDSVMYYLNTDPNQMIKNSDLNSLSESCRLRD